MTSLRARGATTELLGRGFERARGRKAREEEEVGACSGRGAGADVQRVLCVFFSRVLGRESDAARDGESESQLSLRTLFPPRYLLPSLPSPSPSPSPTRLGYKLNTLPKWLSRGRLCLPSYLAISTFWCALTSARSASSNCARPRTCWRRSRRGCWDERRGGRGGRKRERESGRGRGREREGQCERSGRSRRRRAAGASAAATTEERKRRRMRERGTHRLVRLLALGPLLRVPRAPLALELLARLLRGRAARERDARRCVSGCSMDRCRRGGSEGGRSEVGERGEEGEATHSLTMRLSLGRLALCGVAVLPCICAQCNERQRRLPASTSLASLERDKSEERRRADMPTHRLLPDLAHRAHEVEPARSLGRAQRAAGLARARARSCARSGARAARQPRQPPCLRLRRAHPGAGRPCTRGRCARCARKRRRRARAVELLPLARRARRSGGGCGGGCGGALALAHALAALLAVLGARGAGYSQRRGGGRGGDGREGGARGGGGRGRARC